MLVDGMFWGGDCRIVQLLLLLLCTLVLCACGSDHSDAPELGNDSAVIAGSRLKSGSSMASLPEPFPFYRMKTEDIDWYEESTGEFDANGVIMKDYGENGVHYHPVLLASYALRLYDTYRVAGDPTAGELFLRHAEQLANSLEPWYDTWAWVYPLPNTGFGASGRWISGMAQGLCIAVLAQAEALTGDHRFLERAELALQAFDASLADGGVKTSIPEGGCWYEEVAAPDVESSLILNGHIYALAGLDYYAGLAGNTRALRLYHEGVEGVRSLLPRFDAGYLSRYCLQPIDEVRAASEFYNLVHVQQLLHLWLREGDTDFAAAALNFYAYHADALSGVDIDVHVIESDGSYGVGVEDISDLMSDVTGVWQSPEDTPVLLVIRDRCIFPLSGVAVREWEAVHLGDFALSLYSGGDSSSAVVVHEGNASSTLGAVLAEKVRNRSATVWFVTFEHPYDADWIELRPLEQTAGLRQIRLAHEYPLVAVPVGTRYVLQSSALHLFDGDADTRWAVPQDAVDLLILRNQPLEHIRLLWSTSSDDTQSVVLSFSREEEETLHVNSESGFLLAAELLDENLLRVHLEGAFSLGVQLHEVCVEGAL